MANQVGGDFPQEIDRMGLETYRIVRKHQNSACDKVIKTGLTLAEARAYCSRPDTQGHGWFDVFYREEREWTVEEILRREG